MRIKMALKTNQLGARRDGIVDKQCSIPMLSPAFFCSSDTQCLALANVSWLVMSYTTAAAEEPL